VRIRAGGRAHSARSRPSAPSPLPSCERSARRPAGDGATEPPPPPRQGPLSGKAFVITGTLSEPRSHFERRIADNGGAMVDSVTKKTDFVVVGESPGTKLAKAQKLGVEIIDEARLKELIGEA